VRERGGEEGPQALVGRDIKNRGQIRVGKKGRK